jgi:aarF domain-containing kinase
MLPRLYRASQPRCLNQFPTTCLSSATAPVTTAAATTTPRSRPFLIAAAAALSAGAAFVANDDASRRVLAVAASALPMAAEYKYLSFKISHLSEAEQQKHFNEFHVRYADEPLRIALKLRGFYVKMGQVISNQPALLPEPYVKSLSILQQDVPPEKFERIKEIIESELQRPIGEVFSAVDPEPIGAASIGQVHKATLLDGRDVVVKVQYPEAERFFKLDFSVILFAFGLLNPQLIEVARAQQKIFANEFNYVQEAENLRFMVNNASEINFNSNRLSKTKVVFPEPLEELTTRKVLVMTRCEGQTITRIGRQLLTEVAKAQNMTADEFVLNIKKNMVKTDEEKTEVEKALQEKAMRGFGVFEFALLRGAIVAKDYTQNLGRLLFNWSAGFVVQPREYEWSVLPPNGPRLMQILYNEKAYEIFQLRRFNADSHAGNIMLDQESDTVSMLDYGQLIRLTPEYATAFARYIVAIDDGDREEVVKQWKLLGNEFTWQVTGEVNPVDETYACALFHFGGNAGMKKGMKLLKFESLADVMDDFHKRREFRKIDITKTSPKYGMLQRACFCVAGVGFQVGTGQESSARMLRKGAEEYLRKLEREKGTAGGG